MRLLVFGTGVIGSVVGWQLSARNEVTHFVRPSRLAELGRDGIRIRCDAQRRRHGDRAVELVYRPRLAGSLDAIDGYDACLLSVKSNQLMAALGEYRERLRRVPLFIMQNVGLGDYEAIDRGFGGNASFAYPFIMGGGRRGNRVDCAIFGGAINHTVLGNLANEERGVERLLFAELEASNLRPVYSKDIAAYLKLHYVWAACVLGSYVRSGGFDAFTKPREIADSYRAMVECFALLREDGVDSRRIAPYSLYRLPPFLLAAYSRGVYRTDAMRTMMEGHIGSSPDEMKAMFDTVSAYCGDRIGSMRVFKSYKAAIDRRFGGGA